MKYELRWLGWRHGRDAAGGGQRRLSLGRGVMGTGTVPPLAVGEEWQLVVLLLLITSAGGN